MKRRVDDQKRPSQIARSRSGRRQLLASVAAAGVASAGTLARADTSTTLTGLPNTNADVPNTHGDNAEVDLSWSTSWDQYSGWDGRGNVYQMETDSQSITFAPTAGNIQLTVVEFFLDEWASGGNTSSDWSVTGSSSGVIASGTWFLRNNANDPADAGGRDLILPNAQGAAGETLTLSFTNLDSTAGQVDSYLAMDNLVFSSAVVPEPATAVSAWLGVSGLGAMALRRKRN